MSGNGYPSIASAEQDFLVTLGGKSKQTPITYRKALNRLNEFLLTREVDPGNLSTSELPADILETFYLWLVAVYGTDRFSTLATYLAGARAFLRYLFRHSLLDPSLSFEQMKERLREIVGKHSYKTPRFDRRIPLIVTYVDSCPLPPLTAPEGRQLRLELLRDRAILHTLFSTGLRRAEVAQLDRTDLDDGWSFQALVTGKGGRERVVFFGPEALEAIRTYLAERNDQYSPLFLRHDRGRGKPNKGGANYRLSPQSIWVIVKRYARLAGVPATTHHFRHTKATTMLNRGAKLSEIQDLLGHASPETTKRIYARYEVAHLKEAFDRYSLSPQAMAQTLQDQSGHPQPTPGETSTPLTSAARTRLPRSPKKPRG